MSEASNVVDFTGTTTMPMEPDRVLEAAKGELVTTVIVGVTPDGQLWLSGSHSETAENLFLLERAKALLMADVTAADVRGIAP